MIATHKLAIANGSIAIANATGSSVEDVLEALEESTILEPEERDQVIEFIRSSSPSPCSKFIQRFAYRPHPNPKVRKMFPDELQVGWEFEERATGEKRFVHWGSTKNRKTLASLIDDVKEKHGISEVIELSS